MIAIGNLGMLNEKKVLEDEGGQTNLAHLASHPYITSQLDKYLHLNKLILTQMNKKASIKQLSNALELWRKSTKTFNIINQLNLQNQQNNILKNEVKRKINKLKDAEARKEKEQEIKDFLRQDNENKAEEINKIKREMSVLHADNERLEKDIQKINNNYLYIKDALHTAQNKNKAIAQSIDEIYLGAHGSQEEIKRLNSIISNHEAHIMGVRKEKEREINEINDLLELEKKRSNRLETHKSPLHKDAVKKS